MRRTARQALGAHGGIPISERMTQRSSTVPRTTCSMRARRSDTPAADDLQQGDANAAGAILFEAAPLEFPAVAGLPTRGSATNGPFRLAIDAATGWLYWGDVGPDSATDTLATRGPQGHDESNQAKASGFFGWPYCVGANIPYIRYDFAALTAEHRSTVARQSTSRPTTM
jgi:hypothetical protein